MKQHFETLEGLRGTAAFCVLLFHILEIATPDLAHNPLRHTPLAVDFFFAMSGFVMAHAYDSRFLASEGIKEKLTFKGFILRRLIRLHPMAIVAMTVGLGGYILDPFVGPNVIGGQVSIPTLALVFGLSLFLLPSPSLPNRFNETHCLVGPAWSLFQEYVGSIFYGLVGYRLSKLVLAGLCLVSAITLFLTAQHFTNLGVGWGWDNFWAGFVRLAYPFLAGLLIYRLKFTLRVKYAFVWLSLALIGIFCAPTMGIYNGAFEAICVIVGFPIILIVGSGETKIDGPLGRIANIFGRLSYPVYIIHYPAIYIFAHWLWQTKPSQGAVWLAGAGIYFGALCLGWLLLKYYDEPFRAYLSKKVTLA